MRRLLCFVGLLALPAQRLSAATTQVYGGALQALPLYGRLATAREAALGDAFHAVPQGEDAAFANPAGLSGLQGADLGLHHESWIGGIDEEAVEASLPLAPGLGLGVFGVMVNYGSFDLRDAQGLKTGDAVVQDYGAGLGVGLRSGHGFSGGLSLRGLRQDLVTSSVLGLGLDTGMDWVGGQGWSAGLSLTSLRLMDGSAGGSGVRAALAKRWLAGPGWVWPALALDWEPNDLARVQGGLDLRLNPALDLRLGFEQRLGEALVTGLQGLTLGLGFKVGTLALDYAYLPQGDLGGGHRVSLCWRPWQRADAPAVVTPAAPRVQTPPRPTPTAAATATPAPLALPALPASATPTPLPGPTPARAVAFVEDPLLRARQLEAQGRLGEALAEYERLCGLHAGLVGAWRGVADLSYRLGLRSKALAAYKEFLRLSPDPDLAAWVEAYELEPGPQPH